MNSLVLDFWFDFASTYSYPAAMRIGALADTAGVVVNFRPFLLGPAFKAQGWTTSPFNLYPAKGGYMWRDLERICADLALPFRRPDPFPQNSLIAARIALLGLREPWCCRPRRATTTRRGCAIKPKKPRGAAFSARRALSPPAANCSGVTTGSSARCAGQIQVAHDLVRKPVPTFRDHALCSSARRTIARTRSRR